MKFTLAIALLFTSTLALADDKAAPAADNTAVTASPSATPMTKENTSATAKKRLRHIGKNIEKLGDKAGKKAGVKDIKESEGAKTEVPAATASPAHAH